MLRLPQCITKKLSVRLSLMVVLSITVLLLSSLDVMLYYSRKAIKEEAILEANQALDGTVLQIDNILLSIEQAAGNVYWDMVAHLDEPDKIFTYSQSVVASNPYIDGCAIAFEPYYFPSRGKYFMAYVHRQESGKLETSDAPVIHSGIFGNLPYNEQSWYTQAMEIGTPFWTDPMRDKETESHHTITTFCLPISNGYDPPVGIMAINLSTSLLSQIVLTTKPSPHSYCTLLGHDGSYLVHPDSNKLLHHTVLSQINPNSDPTLNEAAESMMKGETGYRRFRMKGANYYVFYKPFQRSMIPGRTSNDIGWRVGIIYPENDIFGDYNHLLHVVITIAIIALLLLMLLSWSFIRRLLKPLQILTQSAQRIADGHYDNPVPDSQQQDEIGQLQNNFQQMQQSLCQRIGELEQLTETLENRGKELRIALDKTQEAVRTKTKFLHNMTNQMLAPADAIAMDVKVLCDPEHEPDRQEAKRVEQNIQQQGKFITEVLNHLLELSVNATRKEADYDE